MSLQRYKVVCVLLVIENKGLVKYHVSLFSAPSVFILFSTKSIIRRVLIDSADNVDVALPVRGLNDVLAI